MTRILFDGARRWYPGAEKPAVPGIDLAARDDGPMVPVGPSGCVPARQRLSGVEDVGIVADPVQVHLCAARSGRRIESA